MKQMPIRPRADIEKKFLEATKKYSITNLMKHLRKASDGTIIVDKERIIHDDFEFDQFVYVLDYYYHTLFKDVKNETMYFEPGKGDYIIGGIYNVVTQEKCTRKVIASLRRTNPYIITSYICTKSDIDEMKKILSNT